MFISILIATNVKNITAQQFSNIKFRIMKTNCIENRRRGRKNTRRREHTDQ